MSHNYESTGRTRYRVIQKGLFRKKQLLVLQIEERHYGYTPEQQGCGRDFDYLTFRDARPEDLKWVGEKLAVDWPKRSE